jgi:HlyD family secretion protein
MKRSIIAGIALLCIILIFGAISCGGGGPFGGAEEVTRQLVEVRRGDLTISVSGSGNIEVSDERDLSFDTGGKIDKIYVAERAKVVKGATLAKLDTDALKLAVTQAEVVLVQAEVALVQAQITQKTAERTLENTQGSEDTLELAVLNAEISLLQAEQTLVSAQGGEDALELAVLNAEISLQQAEQTLDTGITTVDFQSKSAAKRRAEIWLKYVEDKLQEGGFVDQDDEDDWLMALDRAEEDLDVARANYYNALSGYDAQDVAIKKKKVEAAEMVLVQAQDDLDEFQDELADDIAIKKKKVEAAEMVLVQAQDDLDDFQDDFQDDLDELADDIVSTEQKVISAKESVRQAKQSLENARKDLDGTTITAPFSGVITNVYVDEGDVVPAASVASSAIFHLVDFTIMELKVEVDEIDIPGVRLGQRVIIDVDALPDIELGGEVIYISSLSRKEASVVLYEITISLAVPKESGFKAGMSVEADIVTHERIDVLLVPSRAIKKDRQGNSVVEVMDGEQSQEKRVVTGISDGFDTEIIDGLDEDELVVVERRIN